MTEARKFKIIPTLGRKTDVPHDDPTLFRFLNEEGTVVQTHDVGGINFDLTRDKRAASKAYGSVQWSGAANSKNTNCVGMFELYDGTNRDHIMFDAGRFFVFDSNAKPYEAVLNFDAGTSEISAGETITDGTTDATAVCLTVTVTSGTWGGNDAAGTITIHTISGNFGNNNTITSATGSADVNGALSVVTFATDLIDLYSMIKAGSYIVFADRGETTPYKWVNGADYVTKLIDPTGGSGYTEYTFRYLLNFQRRIVGLYSDQTNGSIDIRYTADLPDLTGDVEFPAANQLYVPNVDPITGAHRMGYDKAYIYCEDSINQLVYFPDYALPFRVYTVNPKQGAVSHNSIVNLGNIHYLFNKNYGFCQYAGGPDLLPISDEIEEDIASINTSIYVYIVGTYLPITRQVCWTVPSAGSGTPDKLFLWNTMTKQWSFEDKAQRFVAAWNLYNRVTWNNLDAQLGGSAAWTAAGLNPWAYYASETQYLTYAGTDGHIYYHESEGISGADIDGYRIEPVLDLGDSERKDRVFEIWFDLAEVGGFSIDIWLRSGETLGEIMSANWTAQTSLSCDSPSAPFIKCDRNARLHQIKWGTNLVNEKFSVNGITFKYHPQGVY